MHNKIIWLSPFHYSFCSPCSFLPLFIFLFLFFAFLFHLLFSLSNSHWHSANADVKSKIIVSRRNFFADVIFFATWKVQYYQNKSGEKSLYPNNYVLTRYFKEFYRYFQTHQTHMLYPFCLANRKQLRKWNRIYRSSMFASETLLRRIL